MTLTADMDEAGLEQNRRRLVKEYQERVAQYERRYELKSDELRGALREGKLRETAEVAAWLLLLVALAALTSDRRRAP
jgi:hypothetical protein